MEFLIERASDWDVKPCDEATSYTAKSVTELDETFDHYREYSYTNDEQASGQNEVFPRWKIKFDSIEELMNFTQKHKKIVLKSLKGSVPTGIIIYDYWLE